ncbi:TlpA family protein disulfide reductase [Oceanidesulfovibrio indonesiensis]|uniref:TlpA family protein disulfide reductase n=1 Tax=Oceanidesulfovibrio indonesiensis TaxID=54767 RepID=A0A7M3MB49_9BACT|nr:TlpA disulfide reductase family protein [Oceanidesulfovibrio indonesiensis]TVM14859.1 TlpA family protein disulfide reductase [Oceanidesulfovibrio indonesiensis]
MRALHPSTLWPLAVSALLFVALAALPARAASLADEEKVLDEGMELADIQLAGTNEQYAEYLGIPAGQPFALSDIEADYLLIQVFSMYCPHCQREAPHMKALHERLLTSDHAGALKIIGLGVGNSEYEVGFFRDEYDLAFPLLPDPDYAAYDHVGAVGTPFYALVDLKDEGGHPVLFTQEGTFEDEDAFYELLMEKAGLK